MNFSFKCMVIFIALINFGCATPPPDNQENVCDIFRQYDDWYDDAVDMEKEWGIPISLIMAFVRQESAFKQDAMPPKKYVMGFIPWGRITSAYGYSQALDGAWSDYQKALGKGGSRSDFGDATHFMGWYISETHRTLGVAKGDAYSQYLAYHEGRGGFRRGTYKSKPRLKKIAQKVQAQEKRYRYQLSRCRAELDSNRGWWPF